MYSKTNDFSINNLEFNYINLKKYLYNMYKEGIDNINLLLLISLEKEYYEVDNLKRIIKDLKALSNNLVMEFDILDENGTPTGEKTEKIKFKVNKISLDVGDVLNRHRWTYRYSEKYMLENNLTEETQIPEDIKKDIDERAYNKGKQQGKDWFRDHAVESLNQILPSNKQIAKDFELGSGITEIFEGNEELPRIEYICYEHWLTHPKYKDIEKALFEVINLENSIIDRTYNHEVDYYIERLKKRGETKEISSFLEMFKKYSKSYLVDETVEHTIIQQEDCNNLEFYCFGSEPAHSAVFRGKKAKVDKFILKKIKTSLSSIDVGNWVTIRENSN